MSILGYSRLTICLIGVVLGVTELFTTVTAARAQTPVAEAPTYQVGDEWKYTDGSVLRVMAVEEGQVVTTLTPNRRCPDCRYYRDKNFTVAKVVDKNGKPVEDPTLGLKTREFPLEVGKQWTSNLKLRSIETGRYLDYENSFKVEGYGEVTAKASTFKAFKITWMQRNVTYPWVGKATLWYSPEVKAVVKREVHTAQWINDNELESYTLR